jgi:hypothetical protein
MGERGGWIIQAVLCLNHFLHHLHESTQGASGQAVQNFNVMLGYPETTGLMSPPMFP